MTREEAIKELQEDIDLYMPETWVESVDRDTPDGRLITALEMGIKALEQEPCEDCISREQAFKCFTWTNTKDDVYYGIKALPSIQPKPKTGYWIDITNKNGTVIAIRCDCCGNSPKHAIRSDFCPNCGAKMVEPQENDLGDYLDAIHNQFDNMAGSMNL